MEQAIFGISSTTMAVTAALTAVALVAGALIIAALVGPHSYTKMKGEPYECGIPTRGESMAQFHVGYYLFAILFLMCVSSRGLRFAAAWDPVPCLQWAPSW